MEPSSKSLQTLRAVKLILMIFLVWCQTIEEKEKHLEKVLDCGKEINLTLSADKCEFSHHESIYLREKLTQVTVSRQM